MNVGLAHVDHNQLVLHHKLAEQPSKLVLTRQIVLAHALDHSHAGPRMKHLKVRQTGHPRLLVVINKTDYDARPRKPGQSDPGRSVRCGVTVTHQSHGTDARFSHA